MSAKWSDKHAPKQLGEVAGHRDKILAFHRWLSGFDASKSAKLLLISGPPGCGKTLLTRLVSNKLSYTQIIMDGCELSKTNAARAVERSTMTTWKAIKVCLVIENVEDSDASTLRSLIDHSKLPIIGITSCMYNSTLKMLRTSSRCLRIEVTQPHDYDSVRFLGRVCRREKGLGLINNTHLTDLITSSQGDIRKCLNQLQLFCRANDYARAHSRVQQMTSFDVAKLIFESCETKNITSTLSAADAGELVDLFVQENYLWNADGIEDACSAADWLSQSDYGERSLPDEMNSCLSIAAPCLVCQRDRPVIKSFPAFLGKCSTSRKNGGTLRRLQNQVTRASKTGYGRASAWEILPQLRRMIVETMKKASDEKNSRVKKALFLDVVTRMQGLKLTRVDLSDIFDLEVSGGDKSSFAELPTSTKTSLTRLWT